MIAEVEQQRGTPDILVNSAGINIARRAVAELDPADWDRLLNINVTGAFNCIQRVLPGMRKRHSGLIVNISSVAGKRALKLGGVAYCASKFAMTALGTEVGLEEAPQRHPCDEHLPGRGSHADPRESSRAGPARKSCPDAPTRGYCRPRRGDCQAPTACACPGSRDDSVISRVCVISGRSLAPTYPTCGCDLYTSPDIADTSVLGPFYPLLRSMNNEQPTSDSVRGRPFSIEVAERVKRLPPYLFARINKLMYQKRRSGEDVIDLGMGNPSDPPQDLVIEKLAEAARDPKNHGYGEHSGIVNLRREVASKYFKQYGVRLDPEREVISCLGSKEGFSQVCLALLGPGDTAIIPSPSYPATSFRGCPGWGEPDCLGSIGYGDVSFDRGLYVPAPLPTSEGSDRKFPTQPHDGYRGAGILCGVGEAGETVWIHDH